MTHTPHPINAASRACVLTAAALLCGAGAQAVTVLDTYGPGTTTVDGAAWSLMNTLDAIDPAQRAAQNLALPFSLASATTIDAVLSAIHGSGTVSLQILADVASAPGGPALFTTTLVNPAGNGLVSGIGLNLAPGNYWLAAVAAPGFNGEWQGGLTASYSLFAYTGGVDSATWGWAMAVNPPAARISAVPEPAVWLLLLGGAGLVGRIGRRRAQSQ